MAARRERSEMALRPSVIDRLMAPLAPAESRSRGQLDAIGLRELYAAVGRDLEWLLNTKRWLPEVFEELSEATESIWTYGLPDLSTYSWRSPGDAAALARVLEEVIRSFEPRLRPGTIKVTPLPGTQVDDFRLRFRIDAVLHVEPIREPVSFDTDVDFQASSVTVRSQA